MKMRRLATGMMCWLAVAACNQPVTAPSVADADTMTVPDTNAAVLPDTFAAMAVQAAPMVASGDKKGDSVIRYAEGFLGTPYVSAGCSKDGFDCSGFVYFVFQHFGIDVPRSSIEFAHFGREVPVDSIRKGDIMVFLSPTRPVIGHVGIAYEPHGAETKFIHASSSKEMQVMISSLTQEQYKKRFVKAVRVL